ncbi:MAG: stage III sporulation protein AA [Clostridiaceae bacterium]|nr:stage III sporulation protein AA [Clostridiaceae bacterium]
MKTCNGHNISLKSTSSLNKDILPVLSKRVAAAIEGAMIYGLEPLEEIRLRADKPLVMLNSCREWFIGRDGLPSSKPSGSFTVTQEDIKNSIEMMSENSVYAYQEEIKNGYITIRGGHRVGLTGRVVLDASGVKNIKDISGLNIRLSNQIFGCSSKVMGYIVKNASDIFNTLIISPPQCGKTTILRDIARNLSNGMPDTGFKGVKVAIVDERSELAACVKGIPQNDVGIRTDVLDGCPKNIGMKMMIRSMSPKVIITDEIGNEGDRQAVHSVLNAGVRIITTAHGYNISELKSRREVLMLVQDKVFERYIVLNDTNGPGSLAEVIDGTNMSVLTGVGTDAL